MSSQFAVEIFVPIGCVMVSNRNARQVLCTLSVSPERTLLSRAVSLACDGLLMSLLFVIDAFVPI